MKWSKLDLSEEKYKCLENPNIEPKIEQLYISGSMPDLENAVAIVGSRRVSEYGRRACREFVSVLAAEGLTIISGLMYGVDLEAHNAAIATGGKTVGVLGYGFEHLNRYGYAKDLYSKIIDLKAGAVVSEFNPEVPAAKWTFPQRNRVIAALSKVILVVEASEKSGSLITAGFGVEQSKDVFAVPGSVFSLNSKGTNWIIKQGAHAATSPDDILMYFNKVRSLPNKLRNLDSLKQRIVDQIETLDGAAYTQKIAEVLKISVSDLNAKLSELELLGYISKDISGRFHLAR